MIAAIVIYIKPTWQIIDPICTFIFTILVLFTTIPIFKDCVKVLMEATPDGIDVAECYDDIEAVSYYILANKFYYSWNLWMKLEISMYGLSLLVN